MVAITGDVPTGRRLWLAHVNGSAPDVVDLGDLQPRGIAFRPGANQLAVQASNAAGVTDLYLVTLSDRPVVAGLQLRDYGVFAPDYQMSGVVFSPDGSWIAFNSPRADDPVGGPRYHVALVRPDGTDVHDLLSSGGIDFNQAWPSWSPDGRWIEVESWYDEVGGTGAHQISVAPGDGRGPSRPIGPAFDAQSLTASWSPDGQRIVLGVEDLGEAYLIDPVTGQSDRLPWWTELAGLATDRSLSRRTNWSTCMWKGTPGHAVLEIATSHVRFCGRPRDRLSGDRGRIDPIGFRRRRPAGGPLVRNGPDVREAERPLDRRT